MMPSSDSARDNSRLGQLHFSLHCCDDCVHVLRSMVEVMAARAGLGELHANRVALAVDELYANIARHGYGGKPGLVEFETRLHHTGQGESELYFDFRDYAGPLDESCWRQDARAPVSDAGNIEPGGLGIFLIDSIMDVVEHELLPDGNRWRLIYRCKGALHET